MDHQGHFLDSNHSSSSAKNVDAEGRNIYLQQNLEQTILSVFWRCGKLGAAVFFTESLEVLLLNDIPDTNPNFIISQNLIHNIRPTTIISCNSLSVNFLDRIKLFTTKSRNDDSTNESSAKISLNLFSNKYFQYERCKMSVLSMNIEGKMTNLHEESRMNYLQSFINFSCRMTISALGALLYFMDTYVSKILMEIPSQHITSVRILNLDAFVWMDEGSYDALEIFSSNSHSTVNKMVNMNSKDGFSIQALFNRCFSTISSRQMRILLSHPTKDINELNLRHEVIEFFLNNSNQIVLKNLQDCLKHIGNTSTIIARIIGTQATPLQWKTFHKTLHNVVTIGEICRSRSDQVKFFRQFIEALDKRLYVITQVIENIMDFEQSVTLNRFTVKHGAVPELDEIREQHKNIPGIMEKVAARELVYLPDHVESCSLVYLPEIGYLLGIPVGSELTEEELAASNKEFKFVLRNVVHYKTALCRELDHSLGDSHLILLRHESEIMYQVVDYIRSSLPAISRIFEKIKQLDCLIALSDVAREFELVKPTLTTERVINIKKGRHLLQQLCVNTFVPNDFSSSSEDSFVKIFTGPNSSGKSVYLKQVALIVFLAHIGSFVPAEEATICIMDYLHARIHTVESISTAMSSFMLDLRQMYSCLMNSSPNTLIVIDEFGKGTADIDGLALLAACVLNFLRRSSDCPHIIVSTHFHRLMTFMPDVGLIKPQTLDFIIQNDDITYLYAVKDGAMQSSFAHLAAINAGIPKHIVDRSNQIFSIIQSGGTIYRYPENKRAQLMKRREECLDKLMGQRAETNEDVEEVINILNNCRRV